MIYQMRTLICSGILCEPSCEVSVGVNSPFWYNASYSVHEWWERRFLCTAVSKSASFTSLESQNLLSRSLWPASFTSLGSQNLLTHDIAQWHQKHQLSHSRTSWSASSSLTLFITSCIEQYSQFVLLQSSGLSCSFYHEDFHNFHIRITTGFVKKAVMLILDNNDPPCMF